MCDSSGQPPGTVAAALRTARAALDFLNSPAAADLPGTASGEVLAALGELHSKLTAARAAFLRRFDAADGHDADGYGSSSGWLAAKTGMTPKAAKAAVRQMRQLAAHPPLHDALAAAALTESLAGEVAAWTSKLPADLRAATDKILAGAAAGGATREDLAVIAAAAFEKWRSQQPDPDEDDGFDDRYLAVGTTFGGAGIIRGNLTPECSAAVQAVLESLGKRHGPEDARSEAQRFHDALQLGCELLIRAKMIPDRAGADTRVEVHIPISQLRQMPGASALEQAWLSARLGEPGYLTGKDAEAAACDALTVPVVTGHADMTIIDQIIDIALAAYHRRQGDRGATGDDRGTSDSYGSDTSDDRCGNGRSDGTGDHGTDSGTTGDGGGNDSNDGNDGGDRLYSAACDGSHGSARLTEMSPGARDALRYTIARLAVDFLSGPGGLASALRTGLLQAPYNTPSLPLDIGCSDDIPAHIRRAVTLRDKQCAWPRCGKPASHCDVHHIIHRKDGGTTSTGNCILLCQFHHDVCIHRWGWTITLHPDGTTEARSPDGRQILRSHAPPTRRAG
jgi:hypothetical protein